jgi:hypothetical protein
MSGSKSEARALDASLSCASHAAAHHTPNAPKRGVWRKTSLVELMTMHGYSVSMLYDATRTCYMRMASWPLASCLSSSLLCTREVSALR